MIKKVISICLAVSLCLMAGAALAKGGHVVAVLDVQSEDLGMDEAQHSAMADRLATILAKTGKFQVVPREQWKAALQAYADEKKKPCADQMCKQEVAKSLGAVAVIQTGVGREGRGCMVTISMIDVASSEALAAASAKNKCSARYTMTAMDGAVVLLAHELNTNDIQPGKGTVKTVEQKDVEEMKKHAVESQDDDHW